MRNKVVNSIETDDGTLCVDIFVRRDGSFGFIEYRKDVENAGGWSVHRDFSALVFGSADAALEQARISIQWLALINT